MLSTWFAHPVLLLTLLAVPAALAFLLFAHVRRRQMTTRLGAGLLLRKSIVVRPGVRRWKSVCVLAGLALAALACAGPQWGVDRDAQQRKGRDVILVLDLSRSMSAEQPSRRELSVRALRHLADAFQQHGGNRVALVAFAAKADLLFPLTHDCDHLRHVVTQIEADDVVNLSNSNAVSGTRIGAALKLAVESIDPTRTNRPIIVLLSDGDDPARDGEWQLGITAAVAKKIRVHTVGIGDPNKDETIPAADGDVLQYDGKRVLTRLHENPLQVIAQGTGGIYLPAHAKDFPLGTFVLHLLDADELRDEGLVDSAVPVYQLRYGWFLFPAALLFMLAMFLSEGPAPVKETKMPTATVRRVRPALALVAVLALLCISAADPPSADTLLRQANDAFARQDYEAALKLYDQAEGLTLDPGLVAFNKAAAHYRLGQHKKAIECYRRCLEDDQAPPERRARAHFDLGNSLLHYADGNAAALADAVKQYRACLHQPDLPPKLKADARHNLEIAQLLWLEAWEKLPPELKQEDKKIYPDPDDKPKDGKYVEVEPVKNVKPEERPDLPQGSKDKPLRSQSLLVLPDDDKVLPASPDAVQATIEREARRIAAARRQQRYPPGPAELATKDW
ncbi:MAG: VWA domain-containing protein [Planctomycetes bacterium]|nr:VWA domain-containing protein [Planctomycetota bacterium]